MMLHMPSARSRGANTSLPSPTHPSRILSRLLPKGVRSGALAFITSPTHHSRILSRLLPFEGSSLAKPLPSSTLLDADEHPTSPRSVVSTLPLSRLSPTALARNRTTPLLNMRKSASGEPPLIRRLDLLRGRQRRRDDFESLDGGEGEGGGGTGLGVGGECRAAQQLGAELVGSG
jgi:hypothetical protein